MHEIKSKRIHPYAEPVEVSGLNVDVTYFEVTYVDAACCFPIVKSMVFLGTTESGSTQKFQFQDIAAVQVGADSDNHAMIEYGANGLNCVFEFDKALDELDRCAIRRRQMHVK